MDFGQNRLYIVAEFIDRPAIIRYAFCHGTLLLRVINSYAMRS